MSNLLVNLPPILEARYPERIRLIREEPDLALQTEKTHELVRLALMEYRPEALSTSERGWAYMEHECRKYCRQVFACTSVLFSHTPCGKDPVCPVKSPPEIAPHEYDPEEKLHVASAA
jgi:hypothetical protein